MREMKSYCWERVINRNLHRALDQRAFHFRQNDRKIKLSRYLMCHILGSSRTQIGLSSLQRVVRQHETITPLDDEACLLYTSPSPRDQRGSRMPSSA